MLFLSFLILLSSWNIELTQGQRGKEYCNAKCNKTKVICGSDENDYQSLCHLKKSNCLSKSNVSLFHAGKCDSCPVSCSKAYKPICAFNKDEEKTFLNLCQFKKEMCQIVDPNKKMEVKKKGPCKAWVKSKCPEGCSDIWAPVCASNGKTYASVCAVKMVGCDEEFKDKKPLKLKKIGYCKQGLCPESCPENYRPVCGTDGVLYANECELKLKSCKTDKLKELKRISNKKCGKRCVKDCPPYETNVCGSDGVTYQNECFLQQKKCLKKTNVVVVKREPCNAVEVTLSNQTIDLM